MLISPTPTTNERLSTMKQGRTNQEWLDAMRGQQGSAAQKAAYLDLANYLYKTAFNYLLKRQNDVALLAEQPSHAVAALAQDYVQDILLKLWANESALLNQYQGKGRFLGWAALIIRNHVAGLLRRPPYTREVLPPAELVDYTDGALPYATQIAREEIGISLQACLDALPDLRREVLISCILHGERSKVVAARIHRTVNAVDQLVWHAKRQVRECLQQKGIGPEVLALFG